MVRISVTFVCFAIGMIAVSLFGGSPLEKTADTPSQSEVATPNNLYRPGVTETNDSLPFFKSFGDNEGYGSWLYPDHFHGMKEVWTILLRRDWEGKNNEHLVWSAMVLTSNPDGTSNDVDDFESVSIITEDNHLRFTTKRIHGIQYEFEGNFLKTGKDFSEDEKVLAGTLRKTVKNKQVAKFTADFEYAEPHCFH